MKNRKEKDAQTVYEWRHMFNEYDSITIVYFHIQQTPFFMCVLILWGVAPVLRE